MNGHTHEFEPDFGFPESLPISEKVLWQGSPNAWLIAKRVFLLPHLIFYFLIISFFSSSFQINILTTEALILNFLSNLLLGLVAILILLAISYLISATTVYSITDKRLVMRIGIVLNLSLNIPFSKIQLAETKSYVDKSGDISIELMPSSKIAYLHLWPHCRPWFFSAPRPRLCCLENIEKVAQIFKRSWKEQREMLECNNEAITNKSTGKG